MRDRADKDDTGRTTGGSPGGLPPGEPARPQHHGPDAPARHAQRHGRPAGPGARDGDRRGAELLGGPAQAHLSLSHVVRLRPGGALPAPPDRGLPVR